MASYACAPGVALWRCAAQLRFQHEFEAMLRAVALGEADRRARGWVRLRVLGTRAVQCGLLVAGRTQRGCGSGKPNSCISSCAACLPPPLPVFAARRRGGVAVSELSLARCGAATDGVVAALCDALPHLRRVDLSRCAQVGDAAVARLAAYTRRAGGSSGDDSSGDEDAGEGEEGAEWEDEPAAAAGAEASQAMSGLQLQGKGGAGSPPRLSPGTGGPAAPAVESPDSAVRRLAAQRHATMLARSADAGVQLLVLHGWRASTAACGGSCVAACSIAPQRMPSCPHRLLECSSAAAPPPRGACGPGGAAAA